MRKGKILFLFSFILFIFIFSGCGAKKSSEAELKYIVGYEDLTFEDRILNINVNYDISEFDFFSKTIVSDKAIKEFYSDIELKNKVTPTTLQVGTNTYYLKVISEDERNFTSYQINVKRLNRFTITFPSNENYSFTDVNGGELNNIVDENQDLEFKLNVNEQYDYTVYLNETIINPVNEIYSIRSIKSNLTINVNLTDRNYSISYPEYSTRIGYTISSYLINEILPVNVEYGESVCFRVQLQENYEITNGGSFVVKANNTLLEEIGSGIFCTPNIYEDTTITEDNSNIIRKAVFFSFPQSEYFDVYVNGVIATNNIDKGANINITIITRDGFLGDYTVNLNSSTFSTCNVGEECSFTINNVVENINMTVDTTNIRRSNHNIEYSIIGEGIIIKGIDNSNIVTTIEDSSNFSFYIEKMENYKGDYFVSANGVLIESINGIYTINDVKEDIYISINANDLYLEYSIIYPFIREGYQINNNTEGIDLPYYVSPGESISFKIDLKEGYNGEILLYVNQILLNKDENGLYNITDINENIEISIDNSSLTRTQYSVNFNSLENDKYYINSYQEGTLESVYHGDDFYFIVNYKDGYVGNYNIVSDYEINCNEENLCIAENITSMLNVSIDDSLIQLDVFAINFDRENQAFSILDVENNVLPYNINYGESLDFKVNIDTFLYEGSIKV